MKDGTYKNADGSYTVISGNGKFRTRMKNLPNVQVIGKHQRVTIHAPKFFCNQCKEWYPQPHRH